MMESMKKQCYVIYELDKKPCEMIVEGWSEVRALMSQGKKPRFRSTQSREQAEECLKAGDKWSGMIKQHACVPSRFTFG